MKRGRDGREVVMGSSGAVTSKLQEVTPTIPRSNAYQSPFSFLFCFFITFEAICESQTVCHFFFFAVTFYQVNRYSNKTLATRLMRHYCYSVSVAWLINNNLRTISEGKAAIYRKGRSGFLLQLGSSPHQQQQR